MGEIFIAFQSAKLSLILLALLLLLPNIYFQFYKWRYLVRLVKSDTSNHEVLQSLFAGFTFGFITPGRLGEFGRAFFIKNCPWVKVLGIAALDKLFSVAVVFLFGSIGLLYLLEKQLFIYTMIPLVTFTVITLFVFYYILFHPEIIKSFLYSLNIILPFREKIKLLISSMDQFTRERAIMLLLFNLGFSIIFLAQFYILVVAFQPSAVVPTMLALASTMLVKTMLPISIGDLGIRESAAIYFLGKIAILESAAFNASILLFLINLLIPSLVGLVLVLKHRLFIPNNRK
ncbi:MAG: lysylphosphatidylglycerol synthase domain-containing protein, partial [bacterium]|nr:lysylphosphatidylglycerol synthase domain-containing protein [bacterium]